MNLYELSESYQKIQQMIEDGTEDLEDTLESLNDAIEDKADGYARIIRNLEGQATAIKAEEQRLAERRKHLENNAKRMKDALEGAMLQTGKRKLKTELFSFNIQKNVPSVEVIDDSVIPKNFFITQEPKLDKRALINELKEREIPGVRLKQTERLRIR